jgi:multidrug transporter EmrE-like cation transporter
MNYGFLIIALIFNATANILLKLGAIGEQGTSIKALIANPLIVIGVTIFGLNVYFYIQALRTLPISLVYPVMTAVGFVIINTYGLWVLKEPMSLTTILGYAIIILGIILVTAGYR